MDAPKYFRDMGPRSLAVDSGGDPHIAYGRDHLYYAHHDGSAWNLSRVDASPGVGLHTSLALTSFDYPRISHYDLDNGDLKYALYGCIPFCF